MAVSRAGSVADPRVRWLLGALVFALAAAVFLPVRDHEWLNYDDNVYITESAPVRAGFSRESIAWAFASFDGANWFPLTRLSWMLDSEIHGVEAGGFLVTNLLLHALASLALFAALTRLTGKAGRSAFVAALFAVHPLHVESVAWVAARKKAACSDGSNATSCLPVSVAMGVALMASSSLVRSWARSTPQASSSSAAS